MFGFKRAMQQGARNRVRLWLRAERAFGLSAVAAPAVRDEFPTESDLLSRGSGGASHGEPGERPYAKVAAPSEMAPMGGLIPPVSREPLTALNLSRGEKSQRLVALDENEVHGCTRCRLCQARTNTVFGEGDPNAQIMFIGEGPGENEDLKGRPFVGRAGELLDKQIAAMGFRREQVYIANIVKCRPPGNRQPAPDEAATCVSYLHRQIEIIAPTVIVTLGLSAARYMLDTKLSMTRLRGQWQTWRGIKLMPTFHPAYVLRQYTPQTRAAVWSDLKAVLVELGLPVPQSPQTEQRK